MLAQVQLSARIEKVIFIINCFNFFIYEKRANTSSLIPIGGYKMVDMSQGL